jgi:hypothetical protein
MQHGPVREKEADGLGLAIVWRLGLESGDSGTDLIEDFRTDSTRAIQRSGRRGDTHVRGSCDFPKGCFIAHHETSSAFLEFFIIGRRGETAKQIYTLTTSIPNIFLQNEQPTMKQLFSPVKNACIRLGTVQESFQT